MILTRIIEKFPLNFEMEFHFDLKPPPNVELVFEFDIDDYEILNNQHSILFLKGEISYETPAKNIKVDTFSLYFSDINEIPEYQIPIYYGDMLKFIKLSCKSDFFVGDNDNAVDLDPKNAKLTIKLRENIPEYKSVEPDVFRDILLKTIRENNELGFVSTFRNKSLDSKIQFLENHWDELFDTASKSAFEKTIKFAVRYFLTDVYLYSQLSDKLGDKKIGRCGHEYWV